MANELIKNQEGNLHEFVQNICCSPTGCGGWGCRIVTQRDTLGYIYMSLSGSGVNDGYSFTQRVALGYIYISLSGSCMHTNVVQKARRAKTHIARGNALGTMGNAPWFEDGTHRANAACRAATHIARGNALGTMGNAPWFEDGTHRANAACRAATHIARGNALGTMGNAPGTMGNAPGIMAMSLGQWATFTDKQNIS